MSEIQLLKTMKRGDYFSETINIKKDGVTYSPPVSDLKSQVRNLTLKKYSELAIAATGTPGQYTLTADSTINWPVGNLFMDIEMLIDGKPESSATLQIIVEQDFTYE